MSHFILKLSIQIPGDLNMIRDEANRAHYCGSEAVGDLRFNVVDDVRLQPRHVLRARAGLPDDVKVGDTHCVGDEPCCFVDLAGVKISAELYRPGCLVRRDRNRVSGENKPGVLTAVIR